MTVYRLGMATTAKMPVEGTDFGTYQPGNLQSGWNWYCLHCSTARGWRWTRVDARNDARKHNGTCTERGK